MEYFRCNITRAITALIVMVVSVQGGMFEYILSTQTTHTMNLEQIAHHSSTIYADTENESNDEGYLRRVTKHPIRTTTLHFTDFKSPYSIKWQVANIVAPTPRPTKISKCLSELFCTLLI